MVRAAPSTQPAVACGECPTPHYHGDGLKKPQSSRHSDRETHEMMRFRSVAAVKWPTALCCTLVGLCADTT